MTNMGLFTLGIVPYITASIVMQFAGLSIPKLVELKKEGEQGQQQINQYSRYLTLALATVQSFFISRMLVSNGIVVLPAFTFIPLGMLTLVTGTMFLMWLGDQSTRYGIGNGISIIIFAGIASRFPGAIIHSLGQIRQGQFNTLAFLTAFVLMSTIILLIVTIEQANRKVAVIYPRQQRQVQAGADDSSLPLKLNMVGVMPPILANTFLVFPVGLLDMLSRNYHIDGIAQLTAMIQAGELLHILFSVILILLFAFYLTAMMVSPDEIATVLKKRGAIIPGVRPGQNTAKYIDTVMTRLTLFGALYLTCVSVFPDILIKTLHMNPLFGGTSLLIMVVVIIELMRQVQSHLVPAQMGFTKQKDGKKLSLLR